VHLLLKYGFQFMLSIIPFMHATVYNSTSAQQLCVIIHPINSTHLL
jgi:hypothetical protein